MKMEEKTEMGAKEESPYAKIVGEILTMTKSADALEGDSDAIVAELVKEMKKTANLPEGASEEGLYAQARQRYWDWQDKKREKEKSGMEEYADTTPMED